MLQQDTPFYLVKLIQQQRLTCEHSRYSTFLIQWLPYCFIKFGTGLETITRTYSISFDIYYFLLFLFSFFIFQNNAGSLLLLLFCCLSSGRDYFLPVGEYQSAIITSSILYGITFPPEYSKRIIRLLSIAGLLIIILNFHLIGVISAVLIICWNCINSHGENRRYWLYLLSFLSLIVLLRIGISPPDDYESAKLNSWTDFPFFFTHPAALKSMIVAIHFFAAYLSQLIFLFIFSLIILIAQKKYVHVLILIVIQYSLFILLSVIYGENTEYFLFGGYFLLLIIPPLIPIIPFFIAGKKISLYILIAASLLIFIVQLTSAREHYKKKTDYFNRLIENGRYFPEHKYILDKRNVPIFIENSWPITFQTLLLSSLKHPDSAETFISGKTTESYNSFLYSPASFLGPEWAPDMFSYGANKLPTRYFNLPERGYRKITTSQSGFDASDSLFNNVFINLKFDDTVLTSKRNSQVFLGVTIFNSTGKVIPAIPDGEPATLLSYRLTTTDGDAVETEDIKSSFESDIYGQARSGIIISTLGLKGGEYIVHADILTDNRRWWGLNSRLRLVVK